MKKWVFFSTLIASILLSCEDKTVDYGLDEYYVEIVTAQSNDIFISDNGKFIISSNKSKNNFSSGDRVFINYTLLGTNSSGDYNVRINGSAKIPQANLTLTNEDTLNKSAREPVLLESVWLGSHYLNMQFYINFKSVAHKIALLADSTGIKSDTLRMYFMHDTAGDPPGYPSHSYLSFDLKEVLGNRENIPRPITVQINSSNYGDKIYSFEY